MELSCAQHDRDVDIQVLRFNNECQHDPGRFTAPQEMVFDRLGICRKCRFFREWQGGYKTNRYCISTMRTHYEPMIFCDDNKKVMELFKRSEHGTKQKNMG